MIQEIYEVSENIDHKHKQDQFKLIVHQEHIMINREKLSYQIENHVKKVIIVH